MDYGKLLAWVVLLVSVLCMTYLRKEDAVPTWATITTIMFALCVVLTGVVNKQ